MALRFPAGSESDVRQTCATPDKEVGETRKREEPGEHSATLLCLADERKQAEEKLDDDAPEWATVLVDISQKFGTHAADCESLHGASRAIRAGVGD